MGCTLTPMSPRHRARSHSRCASFGALRQAARLSTVLTARPTHPGATVWSQLSARRPNFLEGAAARVGPAEIGPVHRPGSMRTSIALVFSHPHRRHFAAWPLELTERERRLPRAPDRIANPGGKPPG